MKATKIFLMLLLFTAFGTSEFLAQTVEGTVQTTKPKRKYTKKTEASGTAVISGNGQVSSPTDAKPKRTYTKRTSETTVTTPVLNTGNATASSSNDAPKAKRTYTKRTTVSTPAAAPAPSTVQNSTSVVQRPTYTKPAPRQTARQNYSPGNGGTYNGHQVFVGPKGGKYYINKNGNKTYIK